MAHESSTKKPGQSSSEEDDQSTESFLLAYSKQFIEAVNTRTIDQINDSSMISRRFTADMMNYPHINSWDQYCEMFKQVIRISPNYQINLIEAIVNVDDKQGTADVFLIVEELGQPPGVTTLANSKLHWRRTGKHWLLTSHVMFRGMHVGQ